MSDMHEAAGHAPAEPLDVHAAHEGAAPEQAHMQADPHAISIDHEGQYRLPSEIPNVATLIETASGKMHAGAHGRPQISKTQFVLPIFMVTGILLLVAVLVVSLRILGKMNKPLMGAVDNKVESQTR